MSTKTAGKLILGTQSKRRIEIFSRFTLPFTMIHSNFDEESVPLDLEPKEYVSKVAQGKCLALRKEYDSSFPILTADTSVYFNNTFFNKPKNRAEAFEMLSTLQGNMHQVWTALTLSYGDDLWTETEMTEVELVPLTDTQINQYIQAFSPYDKAGSYAIQDAAGLLVKKIHGDFYNVIGFPVAKAVKLLQKIGINLWENL